MAPRVTRGISPLPRVGQRVQLFPPPTAQDAGPGRRRAEIVQVEENGDVQVLFEGGDGVNVVVPSAWWQAGAFTQPKTEVLHACCELCGTKTAELCKALEQGSPPPDCPSCQAVDLLRRGESAAAVERMADGVRTIAAKDGDPSEYDAVLRHSASLRSAVGSLKLFPEPRVVTLDEVERYQQLDVLSEDAFVRSWRGLAEMRLRPTTHRGRELLRITLEICSLKRQWGDGYQVDIARREAESSAAWMESTSITATISRVEHGVRKLRKMGEDGTMEAAKVERIVEERVAKVAELRQRMEELRGTDEYARARADIDAYARWFHESGIAVLQSERKALVRRLPSVSGSFLEEAAERWLRRHCGSGDGLRPPLRRVVLTNVTFPNVRLPENVSSEFDALVVVCRPCGAAAHPLAVDEVFRFAVAEGLPAMEMSARSLPRSVLPTDMEVTKIERWVEVKSNPDECLEALIRHRAARVSYAETSSVILTAQEGVRYWFPSSVFDEFDAGVTFFTLPGVKPVVNGFDVPANFLFPFSLQDRLFQFAFDRLPPQWRPDPSNPAASWDYLPELYRSLGLIFAHDGDDPADYDGFAQELVREMKRLVARGQLLVVDDPFRRSFASRS